MNYIKYLLATGLVLGSTSAFAQTCNNVTIETVRSGSSFGTAVRTVDRSCGSNGWICLDSSGDLDATTSTRAYAAVLRAQAQGSTVFVSWDPSSLACESASGGTFPVLREIRVSSQ